MKQLYLIYVAVYIIASVLTAQPLHIKTISPNKTSMSQLKPELFQNHINLIDTKDIGNITQEVWQKWSGIASQYENNAQYLYKYDIVTNAIVKTTYQKWEGIQWINDQQYIYLYDSNNLLTDFEYYEWNGKKWKIVGRGEFSNYDLNGNHGEESYSEVRNGNFEYKDRFVFKYDSNNKIVEYSSYYFEDLDWLPFDKYVYEYVGNCRSLSTEYLWNDTDYILSSKIEFQYTSGCSESLQYADFWWLYNGSPSSWIYSLWTGSEWLHTLHGEYVVNNCGWTTSGTLYGNYDSSTMAWGGGSARGFIHYNIDCNSPTPNVNDVRIITAEYQEKINSNWVNSERTWISYEGLQLSTTSENSIIKDSILHQNFPNPFNPSTNINFNLSEETNVQLSIYDLSGKLIKEIINEPMQIGRYSILWDGTDTNGIKSGAGVYIYKLQTDNFAETRKMILLK